MVEDCRDQHAGGDDVGYCVTNGGTSASPYPDSLEGNDYPCGNIIGMSLHSTIVEINMRLLMRGMWPFQWVI